VYVVLIIPYPFGCVCEFSLYRWIIWSLNFTWLSMIYVLSPLSRRFRKWFETFTAKLILPADIVSSILLSLFCRHANFY
ncbi:MAG: hypothetical protein K2H98_02830, partial [Duncaniella sp.]|nr:hypothetical protein [Duncaniella sp.]